MEQRDELIIAFRDFFSMRNLSRRPRLIGRSSWEVFLSVNASFSRHVLRKCPGWSFATHWFHYANRLSRHRTCLVSRNAYNARLCAYSLCATRDKRCVNYMRKSDFFWLSSTDFSFTLFTNYKRITEKYRYPEFMNLSPLKFFRDSSFSFFSYSFSFIFRYFPLVE